MDLIDFHCYLFWAQSHVGRTVQVQGPPPPIQEAVVNEVPQAVDEVAVGQVNAGSSRGSRSRGSQGRLKRKRPVNEERPVRRSNRLARRRFAQMDNPFDVDSADQLPLVGQVQIRGLLPPHGTFEVFLDEKAFRNIGGGAGGGQVDGGGSQDDGVGQGDGGGQGDSGGQGAGAGCM